MEALEILRVLRDELVFQKEWTYNYDAESAIETVVKAVESTMEKVRDANANRF